MNWASLVRRLAPSSRDRRALLLGVVVIGGGSGLSVGGPRFKAWESEQAARATAATNDATLATASAKSLPVYRDSLRVRRARLASLDSTLIEGNSPAEAGAALSSLVADLAESAEVRIASLQLRGDTTVSGGFSRVAVRVVGTSDITGLATLLHDIEAGSMLLAVREMIVSQPEPGAPASRPEMLRVDLVVETLARIRFVKGAS